ncbi:MAG TPA: hypothetical protein VE078_13845, partial [Thermoanaerobaculia bacterium]|nr:hypothetical protein [Thermoanaerobaculia bacterium]
MYAVEDRVELGVERRLLGILKVGHKVRGIAAQRMRTVAEARAFMAQGNVPAGSAEVLAEGGDERA